MSLFASDVRPIYRAAIGGQQSRVTVAAEAHPARRRIEIIDGLAYVAMIAACSAFFMQGGVLGLIGAAFAARFGARQAKGRSFQAQLQGAWDASIAGLWAGMMLGGMIAGLFAR